VRFRAPLQTQVLLITMMLRFRVNNSLLSARNKYFGWQLNVGQTIERGLDLVEKQENGNSLLSNTNTADRTGRNNFIKSRNVYMGRDRLLLNYDVTQNKNNSTTLGNGPGFHLMMRL
jgi:hypothetical protein